MRSFLNLLVFLAGLVSLFYGVSNKPQIPWMIWAGISLVVVTAVAFPFIKKKRPSRDGSTWSPFGKD
jgi:hypothetical protein